MRDRLTERPYATVSAADLLILNKLIGADHSVFVEASGIAARVTEELALRSADEVAGGDQENRQRVDTYLGQVRQRSRDETGETE